MAGSQKAEKTILFVKILLDLYYFFEYCSILNEGTAASSESVDAAELTA